MPHDAGVGQQAGDVAFVERGDRLQLEAGECRTEVLSFAQDRDPGQARLEALQAQLLEQTHVGGDRMPPLLVVVVHVQGVVTAPPAPGDPIGPHSQPIAGHHDNVP